jgi:hypothetical protein
VALAVTFDARQETPDPRRAGDTDAERAKAGDGVAG